MDTHRIVIAGSGPVGMVTALLLARQGHHVTLVDRDPGPVPGREWDRVGVMQFRLPHFLRPQARSLLAEGLPDLYQAMLAAGAEPHVQQGAPPSMAGLRVRRSVLERTLWEHTSPEVTRITGHVDEVVVEGGRVTGLVVDSSFLPADVVVDATGRAGRLTDAHRPPAEGRDSGFAYAARLFQLRPGAEPGPLNGGPGWVGEHEGFLQLVFPQDAGTFQVLLVRSAADRELGELRHDAAFTAAIRAIPASAAWTDPERAEPLDVVRAGANLVNRYQRQPVGVTGLLVVGDAQCTTNPAGARGLALGFQQAAALADLVGTRPEEEWAPGLDRWAAQHVRPWFESHLLDDAWTEASWRGVPPEADGPIPNALVAAAAKERPEWQAPLAPFFGMMCPPSALDPFREEVRSMVRAGWRPAPHGGPCREDLLAAMQAALTPA